MGSKAARGRSTDAFRATCMAVACGLSGCKLIARIGSGSDVAQSQAPQTPRDVTLTALQHTWLKPNLTDSRALSDAQKDKTWCFVPKGSQVVVRGAQGNPLGHIKADMIVKVVVEGTTKDCSHVAGAAGSVGARDRGFSLAPPQVNPVRPRSGDEVGDTSPDGVNASADTGASEFPSNDVGQEASPGDGTDQVPGPTPTATGTPTPLPMPTPSDATLSGPVYLFRPHFDPLPDAVRRARLKEQQERLQAEAAEKKQAQSAGSTGGVSGFDQTLANRYANDSKAFAGAGSQGRCYEYVWRSLSRVRGAALAEQSGAGSESAWMFGSWANARPSELKRIFGLKRIDNAGYDQHSAPAGSVLVYDAGQCGHHPQHGHVEIKVSKSQACSDFCRPVPSCAKPWIYVPAK